MKDTSRWLLQYIAGLYPLGLCTSRKMPPDTPPGVSMSTIRGLEKSGFVREEKHIFFITEDGLKALKNEKTNPRRQA